MTEPYKNEDWRERIDNDVRTLSNDVAGVKAEIRGLADGFNRFSKSFENVAIRQQEAAKPNYIVVFGISTIGITIVLALIGGWTSGYLRDLTRVEHMVEIIQSNRFSENDPEQNSRLKNLENHVNHMGVELDSSIAHRAASIAYIKQLEKMELDVEEHAKDGHPDRIQDMLEMRMDVFEEYKKDLRMEISRELQLRDEIRDNIHQRLDNVEERWADEHISETHHD